MTDLRPPDRRITVVLVLSGIVAVLVALGTPAVISTSNTTEEVRKSSDLQGCRSQFSSLVTDARTEFDIARSQRDTAATELGLLTNAGLQAAVADDQVALIEVTTQLPDARAKVEAAEDIVGGATDHLRDVADDYVAAVSLSREDPDAFLDRCKEQTP